MALAFPITLKTILTMSTASTIALWLSTCFDLNWRIWAPTVFQLDVISIGKEYIQYVKYCAQTIADVDISCGGDIDSVRLFLVEFSILQANITHAIHQILPESWNTADYRCTSPREVETDFWKILYYYTPIVFARNLLRGRKLTKKYFCILFWCLAWGSNPDFTSNKPTHYLLDYGDFNKLIIVYICFKSFGFCLVGCTFKFLAIS